MKYRITRVPFVTAIERATIAFSGPGKLKFAIHTVNSVSTINAPKIKK